MAIKYCNHLGGWFNKAIKIVEILFHKNKNILSISRHSMRSKFNMKDLGEILYFLGKQFEKITGNQNEPWKVYLDNVWKIWKVKVQTDFYSIWEKEYHKWGRQRKQKLLIHKNIMTLWSVPDLILFRLLANFQRQ